MGVFENNTRSYFKRCDSSYVVGRVIKYVSFKRLGFNPSCNIGVKVKAIPLQALRVPRG
jgi:hypothetical protein